MTAQTAADERTKSVSRALRIEAQLGAGYGVEDIALSLAVTVEVVRKYVALLREQGRLSAMFGRIE